MRATFVVVVAMLVGCVYERSPREERPRPDGGGTVWISDAGDPARDSCSHCAANELGWCYPSGGGDRTECDGCWGWCRTRGEWVRPECTSSGCWCGAIYGALTTCIRAFPSDTE